MKYPVEVLKKIKEHLLAEKVKDIKRIDSLKLQDPYQDPERLTENTASDTEASEESSHQRVEALEYELNLNIQEISDSLVRIEKGTYGKCLSCGSFIDTDRLAIKPTAITCVSCAKKSQA